MDEGYIKFNADWENKSISIKNTLIEEMNHWREKCRDKNWIGVYDDGIGFGNISLRLNKTNFLISGSATGGVKRLIKEHFAYVEDYNLEKNFLKCKGQILASSESLSHASIYDNNEDVLRIIHIHDFDLWNKWKNILPTTRSTVSYGTPEMAFALQKCQDNIQSSHGVIVMDGHQEGIIAYGSTFNEVFRLLTNL